MGSRQGIRSRVVNPETDIPPAIPVDVIVQIGRSDQLPIDVMADGNGHRCHISGGTGVITDIVIAVSRVLDVLLNVPGGSKGHVETYGP